MARTRLLTLAIAVATATAMAGPALAQGGTGGGGTGGGGGGGGGGGTTTTLPTPAIAPGTFDGIGPGPVYLHDSFGHAQTTRFKQDGSVIDVGRHPEVSAVRAEYGNNKTETWIGPNVTSGAPRFQLTVVGPGDPFEPYTALQDDPSVGYQDGLLMIVGEPGAPDTRPDALIPFPAPTASASTLSAESVNFYGKTAIGFSTSSTANNNFATNGQVWLQLDTTGDGVNNTWTFHTNGLSGTTLSGTYVVAPTSYDRIAVSYDPVNHVAMATIDGTVVASVPYTAQTIKYAGVEGSGNANVDNLSIWAGNATDPMPASIAAPA